jgi:hypothetical protein
MFEELGLAVIVTGKRMRSLDDPVHVVQDVIEEPFTISRFLKIFRVGRLCRAAQPRERRKLFSASYYHETPGLDMPVTFLSSPARSSIRAD